MTTATDLQTLFSPLKIGNKKAKNRIVSTSHAVAWDNGTGLINDRHVRYHERKAAGGAGIIMTFGSASVYEESAASYGSVSLWNEENEPLLKDLADRVHAHGALIMSQATHMGRRADSSVSGRPIQAPSAVPEGVHREIPHVMRTEEIPPIVQSFAEAAERLERCGWDGIEITSFSGHLIEQFWSPTLNHRTDRYGGDFAGRMRFSIEVIQAVRKAVSNDFIIAFRMAADPKTDALGLDQGDMRDIARTLDDLGCIDMFSISGGTGATYNAQAAVVPGDTFARGTYNHVAKKMKAQLSVPVLVAGRNLDPSQAEDALTNEDCDLVGMTRAIIADPDMPQLAQKGELSRIRPCIACGECIGRLYSGMPVICTVNPAMADDSLEYLMPAQQQRKVVIVGGGPAGMEAARVSAMRGHEVHLLEGTDKLGGKVYFAAMASERPHYGRHIKWLEQELDRLGVNVHLNTKGTTDNVLLLNPDDIVLATGANSRNDHYVTDVELFDDKVSINADSKVLIYDREGKFRGSSVAHFVAEKGASQVEIATPLWSVAEDLDEMQKPELYRLLTEKNVTMSPNKHLLTTKEGYHVLEDTWSESKRDIEKDEMIIFIGYEEGDNRLLDQLKSAAPELAVQLIGDAVSPRRLNDAVSEGVRVGSSL
ncbi:FAD-dependent oxidoreductase [Salicibibacter cibarius]|uniref:FAD-dependent oxidoreductase n=1 Tax=Salicibibacter cibarius TaxID=2743000 RepID=A0A7T6Z5M3_9BACI|nr:FAD-dependent oxidoreductase [Salicibibacter cibarius]QQK77241.1 FAD-dependent oxidoreductase [Salicibibacter cibarius]